MRAASPNNRKRACGYRARAKSAPSTTIAGAPSPLMASRAMDTVELTCRLPRGARWLRSGSADLDDLAPVVMPARRADMMRPELAAVRAFGRSHRLQGVMRAAHVAARFRLFLLGYRHRLVSRSDGARRRPTAVSPV